MPAIPGVFSMPARRFRSRSSPLGYGVSSTPRRMYSAPAPGGPPNLCPDRLSRSTPSASTSIGSRPAVCAASVWNRTPAARASRAASPTCCIVPVSWLACCSVAIVVPGTRTAAAKRSRSTRPCPSHGTVDDLEAVRGQTSADAEDRRVLDLARHDATSRVAPGVRDAPDPERHRLRAAGCERDLVGLGADRARHDAPRILEERPRRAAGSVDHERVAVRVQRGHDRLAGRRRQRRGAGGIEVQLERHSASLPAEGDGAGEAGPIPWSMRATGSRSRDPGGTGTSSRRPR